MNNSLKYGLLGIIALALIANVYIMLNKSEASSSTKRKASDKISSIKDNSSKANNNTADNALKSTNDNKPKPIITDNTPTGPLTSLAFEEMAFDYGDINQDTENEHIFKFTNTGSEPLIITKAKGSCGCTVPEFPDYPIAPGETNVIKVVYKPGKQKNKQSKTVTITANTEPSTTVLRISANVNPGE